MVTDAQVNSGVMIALLPTYTDWCNIDLPHVTLVYAGQKQDLQPGDFNEIAKDAASLAMLTKPFSLQVAGVETYGDGSEQVRALKLRLTTELAAMRRFVEHWNKSQYKVFDPHATIGPYADSEMKAAMPSMLYFDRLLVAWGDEQIAFWLNSRIGSSAY